MTDSGKGVSPITVDDRAEIVELFAQYGWALDTADADRFAGLFTPDGVFDGTSGLYVGHDAIRRIAESQKEPDSRGGQHWVGNSIFRGNNMRCRVQSMCVAPRKVGTDITLVLLGYYIDDCVKVQGRWMFARRRFRPWADDVLDGKRPWEESSSGDQAETNRDSYDSEAQR